jgi:flavorubredoxin
MSTIYNDLHQFSSYVPPIDLSFHQYLLLAHEPVLIHTGSIQQAEGLLSELKTALNGNPLKYIFISHFESDECGGLSLILKHFPDAKPICSEVTARQLSGFGITNDMIIKKPGDKLITGDYELEFISYFSEMHLWEGLLLMENKRGIFFSSDLMFRMGKADDMVIENTWQTEVNAITPLQIPDPQRRLELQQTLSKLSPNFIATGHGPCVEVHS